MNSVTHHKGIIIVLREEDGIVKSRITRECLPEKRLPGDEED